MINTKIKMVSCRSTSSAMATSSSTTKTTKSKESLLVSSPRNISSFLCIILVSLSLHTVTSLMTTPAHPYTRHCQQANGMYQGFPLLDRYHSFLLLLPPQTIPATVRTLTSKSILTSSGFPFSSSVPSSLVVRSLSSSGDNNNSDDNTKDDLLKAFENKNIGDNPVIITRGDGDGVDDSIFEDIATGQPPQWMVMKELLGINIFTYILGGLIVLFLSLNFILGPGWLGQMIGMEGTGSYTDVSDTLPSTVDLSNPDFKL